MTKLLWTPGPWGFERAEGEDYSLTTLGWIKTPKKRGYPHGEYLFDVGTDEPKRVKQVIGNAVLAAAAPEMLTALLRLVNDSMYRDHPEATEMALGAIRKVGSRFP